MRTRLFTLGFLFTLIGIISSLTGCISSNFSSATSPPTLQSVAVTPASPTLVYGSPQQFTATGTYSDGSQGSVTVTWSSDNTGVATVSASGMVTAMAQGTADIIATSGTVHGQTTVTVPAPTLQTIAVTPASPTLAYGTPQQFTALTATAVKKALP